MVRTEGEQGTGQLSIALGLHTVVYFKALGVAVIKLQDTNPRSGVSRHAVPGMRCDLLASPTWERAFLLIRLFSLPLAVRGRRRPEAVGQMQPVD